MIYLLVQIVASLLVVLNLPFNGLSFVIIAPFMFIVWLSFFAVSKKWQYAGDGGDVD